LQTKLEDIQRALLEDRRLAGMSESSLTKTYQLVEKSVERALNFLKGLSVDRNRKTGAMFEQQTNNVLNIYQNDPDAPPTPQSPAGREKIRSLISGLVQAAESGRLEEVLGGEKIVEVISQESSDGNHAKEPDQEGNGGTSTPDSSVP
jgi:hypothetical protein